MFKRFEYKHIVAVVFILGLFMDLLDMTITNVALPTLGRDFGASTASIEWVVTGYLLALAAFIPVSGWAGDRFGTKQTFIFALIMFTGSSVLCGLAWNVESIIAFRFLQGVGGGLLTPVGTTMVLRAFPIEERASVMAVLTVPAVLGPALGPVIGGYLVQYQTWRWIFFINLPIGLTALAISTLALRDHQERTAGRLDVPGLLLSAPGLASLVYALSQVGPRGFGDALVIVPGIAGLVALVLFVAVELRTARPLLEMRLFADPLFRVTNAVQFLSYARFQGSIFLLTLFLQAERGMSPLEAGLTSFPSALGVMAGMPFASRAYRRVGPRRVLVAGLMTGTAVSLAMLAVDLETSRWWLRGLQFLWGITFALSLVPLQTATFANVAPASMGQASAAFNSIRQVGGSFGVALLATTLSNRFGHDATVLGAPAGLGAFHDTWVVAAVLALVACAISLFVEDRLAAATYGPARAQQEAPLAEEPMVA